MIVIGVDVHKHSVSAVAVDEVGRQLDALETSEGEELVAWSKRVGRKRLWALEDCRHVTRGLERTLQRERQHLVRVPPRLTAPERRRGRTRGKSDLIDALAVARAALREPTLDSPRPEEGRLREVKLLEAISSSLGTPARVAVRVNPDFELKGSGMKMGGGPKQFGVSGTIDGIAEVAGECVGLD